MDKGNQTSLRKCRFLSNEDFQRLYDTFTEAFSDYVIPFALTEIQFRNHINLTAVDLERTVGFVENDRLVGFSLNGFGSWHGRQTVYDAGTGVVPDCRRRGISEAMFEMMLPRFKDLGIEQCLLEVITTNSGAIRLYEKLGFEKVRRLALLQCDGQIDIPSHEPPDIEIREIEQVDWQVFTSFWDGDPSWQNSVDAIKRSNQLKRIFAAFDSDVCVGYIIFSSKFGRIAQIAVSKNNRRRGIGTALLKVLQDETVDGYSLQVINIDTSLDTAMQFFTKRGFYDRLNQHEMVKSMI